MRWHHSLTLACIVALVACDRSETAADVPRTADPAVRGLTESDFPRVKELADGVYSYEQLRSAGEERFTTVSLFVVTDQGVLVADGQGSVAETQRMVETIASITAQPITHVVICSDHGDHTAGNSAFPETAVFFAHPTSHANLETNADRPNRPADAPPIVLPTELVDEERVLNVGGREIYVLFLGRAHTGGDLVVYLPNEKIMFMSEAYLNRIFPAMRSAYPTEWVTMISDAQAMDVDVFVPGHGFVESPEILKEELDTYKQAMIWLIEQAREHHAAGRTVEDALASFDYGGLDSWSLFSSQAERTVRRIYMELNGEL